MKKPQYLSQFSHSSMSLFDNLVFKKLTFISKSGLEIFIINNNFTTTKWKKYPFFSLSCSASSITSNNVLVAGDVTNVLTSSPKISMHSSNYSTILTCILLYFIYILTPKKVWYPPLTTNISPKCFFNSFMISPLNFYVRACCHARDVFQPKTGCSLSFSGL